MARKLLYLLIASACSLSAAPRVPAGFEIIASGMEERVEVVVAGKSIGLFDAVVSLDTVKFIQPQSILNAIPLTVDKASADYQTLLQQLSLPLKRNGAMACSNGQEASTCSGIKSEGVDAIYDDAQGSVTLYLRKDWLPVDNRQAMFLAADTHDVTNAFIHQQDLNVMVQQDYSSMYLQGAGAQGVTENSYIGFDWSLTATQNDDDNERSTDINNLYYRYDLARRNYLQLGRMDNRTLFSMQGGNFNYSFLPLGAIDGLRLGSTMSYLNRERASQGTPVVIMLSRSARIDAYRNNQLLSSFYLPAGNQEIDTSSFPNGSYNIELRIYESNQWVRTEVSPFVKTGGMTDGRIHWFVQGGRISDADEEGGDVYQAGFRVPLFDVADLTLGGALIDSQVSAEEGIQISPDFGLLGNPVLNTNLYHSEGGGRGDSEQFSWSKANWPSFNVYRYSSKGPQCEESQYDTNSYSQLACYENINATMTVSLFSWAATLGYMRTENYSDSSTWQSAKSFSDNVLTQTTGNAVSKTWQLSASRVWGISDWILNSTLGIFKRDDDGYDSSDNGFYLSFSFNRAPTQNADYRSESTRLSADYRHNDKSPSQTNYRIGHDWYWDDTSHRELSVEAGGINSDTYDASVSGRINGNYGNLTGTLSDSYDTEQSDHTTAFTGSYSSSLALSREGIDWGGSGYGEPSAAVLVSVEDVAAEGEEEAARLDAQVGGSRAVSLSAGDSSLFPLMAYEPMNVDVKETKVTSQGGMTSIISGAGKNHVMLLPGKMRVQKVSIEQRFGYTGRLLLPDTAHDAPIIGLNSRMLILSEDGGFTAEMTSQGKWLYLLSGRDFYQCPLVVKKLRNVVRYVGKSTCQQVAIDALPQDIRSNVLAKLRAQQGMDTALKDDMEVSQ